MVKMESHLKFINLVVKHGKLLNRKQNQELKKLHFNLIKLICQT